jgi:hypothetical protein
MDRANYRVQKRSLNDDRPDNFLQNCTPAERVSMVWPLTMDVWSFSGEKDLESRLQRHVVCTKRPQG